MEGTISGRELTGFKLKKGIKKTVGNTKVKNLRNLGKFLHRHDASGSLIHRE
jgi:hypothetical protein